MPFPFASLFRTSCNSLGTITCVYPSLVMVLIRVRYNNFQKYLVCSLPSHRFFHSRLVFLRIKRDANLVLSHTHHVFCSNSSITASLILLIDIIHAQINCKMFTNSFVVNGSEPESDIHSSYIFFSFLFA